MEVNLVEGDLLDQTTEGIVNPWNRNFIPWWLLLPQGVSGAIKKRGGYAPFRELRRYGLLPLGGAVATSAGRLPFKAIIHVAGLNFLWRATRRSISGSVVSALRVAEGLGLKSLAFPIIGAGTGGFRAADAEILMVETLRGQSSPVAVTVVRFRKGL